MGYLSKSLQAYLQRTQSEHTPVRVVAYVSQAPTTTISRVAADTRRMALEVLREAGLQGVILQSPTLQPRRIVEGVNTVTLQVEAGQLEELAASQGVEYVRQVRLHRLHLNVSAGLVGVDAGVHARYNGSGVRVAVIDSGIDHNHPDLRGRVNLGLSRNFTGEGAIDDVTDGHGHGTHVAGIIGGTGPNYRGIAPEVEFIACKVFASTGNPTEEGAVIAAVRWAIEQGAHVINYSGGYAPVLNHPILGLIVLVAPPWVWPENLLEEEAEFQRAMDSGVVAVVSAGNEGDIGRRGTLSMPATSPSVISVGSVGKQRNLSGFSSVGPVYRSERVPPAEMHLTLTRDLRPFTRSYTSKVDLVAPGGEVDPVAAGTGGCLYLPGIISALSGNATEEPACVVDGNYVRGSGTSQAAPHISGLAALMLQAARDLNIDLGLRRAYIVKNILRAAAQRLDGYRPAEQGRGLPEWATIEGILQDIAAGRTRLSRFRR